ncbi:Pathogenesis-related protein [Thalictrum thalictroides]|uniref:Pathogenesis-related protein n=1 Tax=Thalictrum thalictroides TaxID=46969 RepID=A0A7J6WL92_THATH|nr:Pathogenesis-related protein [Thalictrum thalictroides]
MSMIQLALLCVVSLVVVHVAVGQNTPTDFLNAHNTARAQVGVGAMVWNTTVAAYAQTYANQMASTCNLVHSNGPYGENLAWGSSSTFTGTAAVNMWVAEKQYYSYSTNTCASGKVCGHYTQVVWANSVRLGCARVVCNNNAGTFIICSYDPPGNYVGQKPY